MNFLRELKKKRLKASEVWNEDGEFYFNSKEVKKLWRFFWDKRKEETTGKLKELRIELKSVDKSDIYAGDRIGIKTAISWWEIELSWIEKQLKESE